MADKPLSYDCVVHENTVVELALGAYLATLAYAALLHSHFVPEITSLSNHTQFLLMIA
jgi:hypothetical protein